MLPRHPDNSLCPTTALLTFLHRAGDLPPSAPALAYIGAHGKLHVLTPPMARQGLKRIFRALGLPAEHYSTHSLRRSGATHLLASGVPVELIKIIGDWKSDCIFKYLTPNPSTKLNLLQGKFNT